MPRKKKKNIPKEVTDRWEELEFLVNAVRAELTTKQTQMASISNEMASLQHELAAYEEEMKQIAAQWTEVVTA